MNLFSHWRRSVTQGEVTASVMGLLSLELPFAASQGDKVKQLYLKL